MKMQGPTSLFEARGISKAFGAFWANKKIDFDIESGEIHALLGENGAGKSTLVKMIYGILQPTEGQFFWRGKVAQIQNPNQARSMGIGMVFQHFSLFPALTVAENIQLSLPGSLSRSKLKESIRAKGEAYGLQIDPDRHVHSLSVGEQQRVEVLRALLQDPGLLILDEPTSVLTPQEADSLFDTLRRLKSEGCSILYISHRLEEIVALCDRATILRLGERVADCDPKEVSARDLAHMMVGDSINWVEKDYPSLGSAPVFFRANALNRPREDLFQVPLKDISFEVRQGEVLGIAGIAGNGQGELMEALVGEWQSGDKYALVMDDKGIAALDPNQRRKLGMSFVPEERNGHAAVSALSLSENLLLSHHATEGLLQGGFIRFGKLTKDLNSVIADNDVRIPHSNPPASALSGGNLQKFILGRELARKPRLLIAAQPTWGVDAAAASAIRQGLIDMASEGSAVVVISQDLDEIFEVSDTIAVLHEGELSASYSATNLTREDVGLLMIGAAIDRPASKPVAGQTKKAKVA